jgi:hypothetical protein
VTRGAGGIRLVPPAPQVPGPHAAAPSEQASCPGRPGRTKPIAPNEANRAERSQRQDEQLPERSQWWSGRSAMTRSVAEDISTRERGNEDHRAERSQPRQTKPTVITERQTKPLASWATPRTNPNPLPARRTRPLARCAIPRTKPIVPNEPTAASQSRRTKPTPSNAPERDFPGNARNEWGQRREIGMISSELRCEVRAIARRGRVKGKDA